ncbi:MAG: LysR substrate-binding domain-containing protein [Rubrivivax sp.]
MDQLRSMRIFASVVDEGGFARAARALTLAPAVVTRAVADLEHYLGARLLNRSTRQLALTEIGARYLERVRTILTDIDESEAVASDDTRLVQGHLRVRCSPAVAVHQLAKHLPAFHGAHPQVTLEISSSGPIETVDDAFDLTLFTRRTAPDGEFVARMLARSEVVVCAAPAYLQRRGRPHHPSQLTEHDVLMPPGAALQPLVFRPDSATPIVPDSDEAAGDDDAGSVTISPVRRPAISSEHSDTLYAAALNGLGIVGLPSFVIETALLNGSLERALPGWHLFSISLWAGMPSRRHLPARTRAFLDFLLSVFGGHDHDPWLAAAAGTGPPAGDGAHG